MMFNRENIELIPGILAKNHFDFETAFEKVNSVSSKIHIDISDGVATPVRTVRLDIALDSIGKKLPIIHIMSKSTYQIVESIPDANSVLEVIFHPEWEQNLSGLLGLLRQKRILPTFAICPFNQDRWSIEEIKPVSDYIYGFMVLAVRPGFSGHEFDKRALDIISELKAEFPNHPIAVDGGITPKVARKCSDRGASVFYATSYLGKALDLNLALEDFRMSML